ncbi:hypothetical protein [Micromonospora sp. 15K316]|uniref:hypothetical protein n=1 Tax=Micromonospora sp. 15K316 TaxID=2530376 RepID=UPI001A9DAAEB|nr:hypothetical protein [Micromonospora sp. 15K316]
MGEPRRVAGVGDGPGDAGQPVQVDVAGLVAGGEPGDVRGDPVRRVAMRELEQASRARRLKISTCGVSSAACAASCCMTSRKCGCNRDNSRAGITNAACSFSARYVITWTTAAGAGAERRPGESGGRDPLGRRDGSAIAQI